MFVCTSTVEIRGFVNAEGRSGDWLRADGIFRRVPSPQLAARAVQQQNAVFRLSPIRRGAISALLKSLNSVGTYPSADISISEHHGRVTGPNRSVTEDGSSESRRQDRPHPDASPSHHARSSVG